MDVIPGRSLAMEFSMKVVNLVEEFLMAVLRGQGLGISQLGGPEKVSPIFRFLQ